ncbi:hypothetical protein MMC16_001004 [Acarospora aff. strigata]|nr:hypothetical protein [Acarospora aff. strigata]
MYNQGDPMNYQAFAAAQQELSRKQLADWDASARSWLQTADEVKIREQKQLMLVLDNVRMPVNQNISVYGSVLQAWKTAMSTMENLIKGMPQRVQDGAVFLGLSAWHLYPDILVLGETVANVALKDPLVAVGGSLTIGLTNASTTDDENGVYWSLSLAHLTYYGQPVVSSRTVGSDPSRLTFKQLEMVLFGSVLSGWGGSGNDIFAAANYFLALEDHLSRTAQAPETGNDKTAAQREEAWPLFPWYICGHSPAMFGLSSVRNMLPLLKGDEERICVLRNLTGETAFRMEDDPRITILSASGEKHISLSTVPHSVLKPATTDDEFILPRIDAFRNYFDAITTAVEGRALDNDETNVFSYLCGDPDTAALFWETSSNSYFGDLDKELSLATITEAFRSNIIRTEALVAYLEHLGNEYVGYGDLEESAERRFYRSLRSLESVAQVYKQLPNATVSVDVVRRTLHEAHWATGQPLNRSSTFAAVAMFELGTLDIEPNILKEVMAMSSGNSIFVAAPLLCDPSEVPGPCEIRRIIGNVGRAGIAMLIPPQDPLVREPKLESWNLINHAEFDGTTEDCFRNTTLHLSFTGYELPISIGSHGRQDTEVFFLESLVSVHDQGQWVADLDVLKHISTGRHPPQLDASLVRLAAGCVFALHQESVIPSLGLIALDNWEEFLGKPESLADIVETGHIL